jgi:hypothetical protein
MSPESLKYILTATKFATNRPNDVLQVWTDTVTTKKRINTASLLNTITLTNSGTVYQPMLWNWSLVDSWNYKISNFDHWGCLRCHTLLVKEQYLLTYLFTPQPDIKNFIKQHIKLFIIKKMDALWYAPSISMQKPDMRLNELRVSRPPKRVSTKAYTSLKQQTIKNV